MPLSDAFLTSLRALAGPEFLRTDPDTIAAYSADALGKGHPPDAVITPGSTQDVADIAWLCNVHRVPMVVRGAGTGYTGGAVPTSGGLVISMERMNRILDIDETNLLAVVEPNVITGHLQREVEKVGLFYPPDPASQETSSIGGNVAECAGGPRAFKYGTTKRYVLALEAVLPTGEIIQTGSKAVKNVVGYDLTQLLVGSEGTLAIITKITLRLVPKPPAYATVIAMFPDIQHAVDGVSELVRKRVVPAAIELIDQDSLDAVQTHTGTSLAAPGTRAVLIVEADGTAAAVEEDIARVEQACRESGASVVRRAQNDAERTEIWNVRRQVSLALRATGLTKINHDVVVPRGRVPELMDIVQELKAAYGLRVASFGHAGDGNIHVNLMIDSKDPQQVRHAKAAERTLFECVVELEGSISGEHGIGFAKARYLDIELSSDVIALMRRVKAAFDPNNILNPGKIFP